MSYKNDSPDDGCGWQWNGWWRLWCPGVGLGGGEQGDEEGQSGCDEEEEGEEQDDLKKKKYIYNEDIGYWEGWDLIQ